MDQLSNFISEYLKTCETVQKLNSKTIKAYRIDLSQFHTFMLPLADFTDWNLVEVFDYENLEDFFRRRREAERDLWLTTTKAPRSYQEARFTADSWLFFGKETAGLPLALRERYRDRCVRLPMVSEARSLNLSNTVAVCVYEALRQNGFPGLLGTGEMAWG